MPDFMTTDPTQPAASLQPLATTDNKGGTPQARVAAVGALLLHGASRRDVLELTTPGASPLAPLIACWPQRERRSSRTGRSSALR